jgi:hypothetical protein
MHGVPDALTGHAPLLIGAVHAYRGESDAAITWLERAYRLRDDGMVLRKVHLPD